jgi:hypothetical protein
MKGGELTPRKFSRSRLCSHSQPLSSRMDPLDLDLINDLFEGEANLKEVNGFLPWRALKFTHIHFLHRKSASRVENLKRKHE